ncbi:Phage protein [Lactiplantibacillus plantarum]|uniref:DUF1642 domain-containing protein n=1 Tax=Lactiplantibacillus plantarum TaxID=1590 RepID=UPI0007C29C81|nr:DUF1642 domain-containing protein [Lactiplantibacillus plantarum]KZU10458.1 Phage protein [Lactiplantibacillus plantarum]
MIKVYRKTATIKAEQFDGSDEMVDKYELDKPVYLADGGTFGIETLEGYLDIEVGDWIATGVNGEHWPIADDVFNKTYAELPVIPKAVADYMKDCNNIINLSFHSALYEAFDELFAASQDVEHWIEHNSDVFARAWLDGYTVEEDK